MSDKITSKDLEKLIRLNIRNKGLSTDISEEKIAEIKEKIKQEINKDKPKSNPVTLQNEAPNQNQVVDISTNPPSALPSPVQKSTEENVQAVNLAQKEGEISAKEQEIAKKEGELNAREQQLKQKEQEASYKPQLPSVLENIGAEKMFVFSRNEISLGAEALTNTVFRLCANPDEKKSVHDVWIAEGKTQYEIYLVHFEKIGNMTFDPFQGTTNFDDIKTENVQNQNIPQEDKNQEQKALDSQRVADPLFDSIEPVKDVTLEPSTSMGLDTVNVENVINKKIEEIIGNYFYAKRDTALNQ